MPVSTRSKIRTGSTRYLPTQRLHRTGSCVYIEVLIISTFYNCSDLTVVSYYSSMGYFSTRFIRRLDTAPYSSSRNNHRN
eukprot:scaffold33509_cov155-Skeletonema_dohrnii-CCMP3373.AAC.2